MQESDFHLPNVGLPGYPNANFQEASLSAIGETENRDWE